MAAIKEKIVNVSSVALETKRPILVSACLLGINCKYNGQNNRKEAVINLAKSQLVIPVCPEVLGGLPTPRAPQSIAGGTGADVLDKKATVLTNEDVDVTENFLRGAEETLKIAEINNCSQAIFKERSPSCGVHFIHSFDKNGKLIPGEGVTTALLKRKGIKVISDEEL
ncbi:MAG: DUF523 domain-containing protein [Candidatus Heimdallarchaeota archaeon]|nr:MAG: DUF523 domain-containing protein [Candidatus Gerdarchaeota archaeon]